MESSGLVVLVLKLMIAISSLTGYAVPGEAPRIEFVSHDAIAGIACGEPCTVQGWYGGGTTIYLDDRLMPGESLWGRGILVHELVHYMQEKGGAYGLGPTCERWRERERQAYDVQREWLQSNHGRGLPTSFRRLPRLHFECDI